MSELKDAVNQPTRFLSPSNRWISGRIVDQDGKAGTLQGQELIRQISVKLDTDLRALLAPPFLGVAAQRRRIIRDIRQAATWLYAGAPPEVIHYLKDELTTQGKASPQDVIEAASRAFTAVEDFEVLYRAIIGRIQDPGGKTPFPIYSARAIYRVLELRASSPAAMTRTMAETFVEQALRNMEKCIEEDNFKHTFFQALKLFLYLLRYREIDQTFLRYDHTRDRHQFERVIQGLDVARSRPREFARAEKIAQLRGGNREVYVFRGIPRYH
jgi:hypothetical protein